MPLYIDLLCYADVRGVEIKFFFLVREWRRAAIHLSIYQQ